MLKITFQHFLIFFETVGNCQKSSEILGKNRKMLESSQNNLPTLFKNFQKFSEIFESIGKCSKNFNPKLFPWKIFKCNQKFMKIFYNIPISDTCGLGSNSRILICILHWYYAFCTGITLFALVLLINCTTLSQSELSNFFTHVITMKRTTIITKL